MKTKKVNAAYYLAVLGTGKKTSTLLITAEQYAGWKNGFARTVKFFPLDRTMVITAFAGVPTIASALGGVIGTGVAKKGGIAVENRSGKKTPPATTNGDLQ